MRGRAVMWFRRDLRVHDQPALLAAAATGPSGLTCLYVLDDRLLGGPDASPRRIDFLLGSLRALAGELERRGSRLEVRRGRPEVVVPAVAESTRAEAVFVSRDAAPFTHRRDAGVEAGLGRLGVPLVALPGLHVHEVGTIRTAGGGPYRVFGPFWRAWGPAPLRPVQPAPASLPPPVGPDRATGAWPRHALASESQGGPALHGASAVPGPGEPEARRRLEAWSADGLAGFADRHGGLDVAASSGLSAALRFGLVSPVEVVALARRAAPPADAAAFARQLAWRDFYAELWARGTGTAGADRIDSAWRADPAGVEAWLAGRTGYPLVDAAMRQLSATGWLPNRARLVAASFLVKDLLVDWRVGERLFRRLLVDGDPASDVGNWRWVAGDGPDAAPWWRILDPVRQAERFDPGGDYVRRWLPELADVPDAWLARPWTMPLDV
ncbi:MAG TPA: deoxyribodipyrimidine photo-lyase, partial [Candidatus Limnocylindrales bacterium]